ncbi:MAG: alpha/beta hydrolase [Gammaproteobacteria bacterium]|nr:MAG: alpha/beta hydrolase [Gammaproteobacteria bacterium]
MNYKNSYLKFYLTFILISSLSACSSIPSSSQRQSTFHQLTSTNGWKTSLIHTQEFDLMTAHSVVIADTELLTIYIEGDGLAWLNKHTVSSDPTPINPLALRLSLNHAGANAAYLARPCQFTGGINARGCNQHIWTDSRFSNSVISSSSVAIDTLKKEFNATKLRLIGFSGGAAVAALLVARRDDVSELITVAGNLDHFAWTQHHKISPLTRSLNPVDYLPSLAKVKQFHFVGSKDTVMPSFLAQQFVDKLPANSPAHVFVIQQQTHSCCWQEVWPELLSTHLDN